MAGSLYHKVKALPRSQQAVASGAQEGHEEDLRGGAGAAFSSSVWPGTALVGTYSTFHPLHAALRMARFSKILDNNS